MWLTVHILNPEYGEFCFWFDWMFYDHLSAHSLLAKLAKDFIPTLPWLGLQTWESTDVSCMKAPSREVKYPAGLAYNQDKCRCVKPEGTYERRVWNVLAGGRLQLGLKLWFPPDPRRRCSKSLNLNWWTAFCMTWYQFLIMAHHEEPAVLWAPPFY